MIRLRKIFSRIEKDTWDMVEIDTLGRIDI